MLENEFDKLEQLAGQLKTYVNTEISLAKITLADKVSKIVANLVVGIMLAVIGLLCLIFLSLCLAIFIGDRLGHAWAGFLFVAGIYLLLGIITWVAKDKLIRIPVMNAMIRQLFNKALMTEVAGISDEKETAG